MTEPLHVLYNGGCPICSREIRGYRRMAEASGAPIVFEDLRDTDLARWGIGDEAARKRLHVRRDGRLISGVPAFIAVWNRLPRLAWLARVVDRPVLRPLAGLLYDRVAAPALYALDRYRRHRRAG